MRFQIVDPAGNVILEWDVAELAQRFVPQGRLARTRERRRARFAVELAATLEALKRDLHAL